MRPRVHSGIAIAVLLGVAVVVGASGGRAAGSATPPEPAEVRLSALVTDPLLAEISGIAESRRRAGVLWVENDSGNPADLYAIDTGGHRLATVHVDGARNIDWEDLAAFELDGKPYVLVGDIGDNGGRQHDLELYVLAEPDLAAATVEHPLELTRKPAWIIEARWPDGARDCEALAVDVQRREVLLMSKRRVPPELFRLRLDPPRRNEGVRIAEQVGFAYSLPQASPEEQVAAKGIARIRHQVTAIDLSPDGRRLAVLTYDGAFLYDRSAGADWAEVLRGTPQRIALPPIPQAEALAFSRDAGTLWISSEKLPAPLLQVELPAPANAPRH